MPGVHQSADTSPTRMTDRVPITVVIATLNEAPRLAAALDTVRWADEVIVADAGSTDATTDIARSAGARVLTVAGGTIGPRRARTAFRVRSRNWHLGTELRYGPWGRDWKVRVFSSDQRYTTHRVHEHLQDLENVGALDGELLHYPYRDLPHHVMKIAKYSRWAADDLKARGRRPTPLDVIVRPFWRFFRDYVVYAGWRDGRAGFVVSVVSAFSVFCKYATLLLPGEQNPF